MLAIAHRTPRTAEGCRRLAELGVSVFEVDVQFLAGLPVASHFLPVLPAGHLPGPSWLRRLSRRPGLSRLRYDRWRLTVRARSAAEEDVSAVLDRVPAGAAVLADLKTEDPASAAALVELLRASGRPPSGWFVSAKDPALLAVAATAGYRTWLSIATRQAFAAALAGRLPAGLDAVTVRHTYLDRAAVDRLREHVPRVMAWTVADVRRAAELAAAGVAGLASDSAEVHAYAASRP